MRDIERRIRLVGKILKMTRSGDLVWELTASPEIDENSAAEISESYTAESEGLKFALHQRRPRLLESRGGYLSSIAIAGDPRTTPRPWETRTILRVWSARDDGVELISDVGDMPLLRSLYSTVRRSVTKIDDDIEAFIAKEDVHAERPS